MTDIINRELTCIEPCMAGTYYYNIRISHPLHLYFLTFLISSRHCSLIDALIVPFMIKLPLNYFLACVKISRSLFLFLILPLSLFIYTHPRDESYTDIHKTCCRSTSLWRNKSRLKFFFSGTWEHSFEIRWFMITSVFVLVSI